MYKNEYEHKYFIKNALAWKGSVTPRILLRVLVSTFYSVLILTLYHYFPQITFPFGPFELFGIVLGLLLVFRINAGHDRWWEARKIWGGIVNQSRNLAYDILSYGTNITWKKETLRWVIAFPYACQETLSGEKLEPSILKKYFSERELATIYNGSHIPSYINIQIAKQLNLGKKHGFFDGYVFLQLDKERADLINHIGACERILKTPMPLVYAIKLRRFILIFLLILPFALLEKAGNMTPFFALLVSYPLFSLDQIGVELQNPFSYRNLSHLPLDDICQTIEKSVLLAKNRYESDDKHE
ncbi:MAG: bestrophin family protein [Gammaproteobacteria bacterium]